MPQRILRLLPASLAGLAIAACAPVEGESGSYSPASSANERECFSQLSVTGYRRAPESASGAEQIYVDVGASDTYLFETFGGCPQLDWSRTIAFDTKGFGRICTGLDVDLIVPDRNLGPRNCPVRMVRKLGPEEDDGR
ncbi:DUF6491 family protein [Qipengyuania sp. JC766]|uniref:DUF6491 family protein n=1 Tax=Qipengyuania sp. JC766 TaxID=3232139 RepID=UPI00345A0CA6